MMLSKPHKGFIMKKGNTQMYNENYTARARIAQSANCAPCSAAQMKTWGLSGYPLASVYAPLQEFCDLYDLETALERGTLFRALDLPFAGKNGGSKGGFCRG